MSQINPSQEKALIAYQFKSTSYHARPRRLRMRMMIVVPTLAKANVSHPPEVARIVVSREALRAPHVGSGIHEPGRVQQENRAEEEAPHQQRPSANRQEGNADPDDGHIMILTDPHVKLVFAQVRNVGQQL